ncbi:glycoside hydrolase family 5 protein [Methylobacterium sp. J-070]|uniref:glycoside hydrolase family 5 protein n=1 Tax=Methylobacterium sp. J-070 TaxID=2836650 RepID=UPI001FBA95D3|nr:glycoside hydrolase family 5 protein [Methylobacterium sp. J-070]MCJ2053980.1 glycoside hydrolase family 5 protein [Methylobacterium sp. J-070]
MAIETVDDVLFVSGPSGGTGQSAIDAWRALPGNAGKTDAQYFAAQKGADGLVRSVNGKSLPDIVLAPADLGAVAVDGDLSAAHVTLPGGAAQLLTDVLAGRQPLSTVLTALSGVGQPALRATGSGYQVQPDKTIQGPDGKRFIAKFATFADGLFISGEARANYNLRQVNGQPVTTGGSSLTGFEASVWGAADGSTMRARIFAAACLGLNGLRVGVEPAVLYTAATASFPSHLAMMDFIVDEANKLGMVVQFQNGNDAVPTALNVAFHTQLGARYANRRNVWIGTANEINCSTGGSDCTNPTVWAAEQVQYVQALRGSGFLGPIVLNPTNYGYAANAVASALLGNVVFTADPNLVVGIHIYQAGEATFADRRSGFLASALRYLGVFALTIDEVGLTNDGTVRDPTLDPSTPGTTPAATLASHYAWIADLLADARRLCRETAFSGVTVYSYGWYVPGLGVNDPNSLTRQDGTLSAFGQVVRDNWLAPSADTTTFAGKPLVNLLYNADMSLNTRGFAGGAAATGVGTYDGWVSVDSATNVTRASDGTITLSGGYLRQTIRDRGAALAGEVLVASLRNLTGSVEVTIDWPGSSGNGPIQLNAARGRGTGAAFAIPTGVTGDLTFTLHPVGGTATFKDPQAEIGYKPTQSSRQPPVIDRALARAHVQKLADPAGAYFIAGTLIGLTSTTLTFAVPYPTPMRAVPASAAFVGAANTDYGIAVANSGQAGFTFTIQNIGSAGLQIVATKSGGHGLTQASFPTFFTAAGGILLSAE